MRPRGAYAFIRALVLIVVLAGAGLRGHPAVVLTAASASLQHEVAIASTVTTEFPIGATFSATIPVEPPSTVSRGALYYRIGTDETLNMAAVPAAGIGSENGNVAVSVFINFQAARVPLGVSLTWFWELSSDESTVISTADESMLWMDNRFDWESYASGQVNLYTYDTSPEFAQWMLDQSQSTLDDLEARYGLDQVEPVAVWVYPDPEAFASTRHVNTRGAIAGISYPGASVIAATIRDGDEQEFGRVVPHEISHQVLFHATENPFSSPPLWFDEGLATHYQTGGTDHYAEMVQRAWAEGMLFDITSLNVSFPFNPSQATLAYASSWSMIQYLEVTYGPAGVSRLIEAFGMGVSTDNAIREALGISAAELNDAWHVWVGEQGSSQAMVAGQHPR